MTHPHLSPLRRATRALFEERNDLWRVIVYTLFIGILSLIVPIVVQVLVNTIAAGILVQPVVVLSLLVLGCLLCAGAMRVWQFSLIEMIQQRVFAKESLALAEHMTNIRHYVFSEEYGPELVNRFFDTQTIQKSLAKLLLNGPAAVLQMLIGLVLMAFYSPFLLAYAVVLILAVALIMLLGRNGVRTSIVESDAKYRVAHWLEEVARCQVSFKSPRPKSFALERSDDEVTDYIGARRRHFAILRRQIVGNVVLQAFGAAGILAIGGWLVINRQLTLGQLVAAELIVTTVLSAVDKLIFQTGDYFDLLTAYEKIGHVIDLPVERTTGTAIERAGDASFACRNLSFAYPEGRPLLRELSFEIALHARIGLVGVSGAGKTTLAHLLGGYLTPTAGTVTIDGQDMRELRLRDVRDRIAIVGDATEIFEGTLEENLVLGRTDVRRERMRAVLEDLALTEEIANLPEGLGTMLNTEGRMLSLGQRQRLLLARAILGEPDLLVLDEAFSGVDPRTKNRILRKLMHDKEGPAILVISHHLDVLLHAEIVHVLEDGRIRESGPPRELLRDERGAFALAFADDAACARGAA